MEMKKGKQAKTGNGMLPYFVYLLLGYALTGVLLCGLAFLLYRFSVSSDVVAAGIDLIYFLSAFFTGFLTGSKVKNKKYAWGSLMGIAYFLVLALLSVTTGLGNGMAGYGMAFLLCAVGGMAGGMASGAVSGKRREFVDRGC